MNRFLQCVSAVWALVIIQGPFVWANTVNAREEVINRELDCVSQKLGQTHQVTWNDVCYTDMSEQDADSTNESKVSNYKSSESPSLNPEYDMKRDNFNATESPHLTQFEISPEAFYYWYTEPNGASSTFAKLKGTMYGINAKFTHRISENQYIHSWQDILSDVNKINMFRVEGRFAYGSLDYSTDVAGIGTDNGEPNYVFEGRGLIGYDIPVFVSSRVTPYLGIGYRYLLDDAGGHTTDSGALGYDRESHYAYIPIGLETNTHISSTWDIGGTIEYDYFLGGKQYSHFEDISMDSTNIKNTQHSGYGVRGSVKLAQINEGPDYFIEPFVRYWHINDSDFSSGLLQGSSVIGLEPANSTTEYGINLGVHF